MLSGLFLPRCFLTLSAFLIRFSRSSGIFGAVPEAFNVSWIVFPITGLASGIPYLSRSIIPIVLALLPSFASLAIKASTSSALYLHQEGGFLLKGLVEPELPRLPEYRRAIANKPYFSCLIELEPPNS